MSDETSYNTKKLNYYILLIVEEPVDSAKYAIVTLDEVIGNHRRENIKAGRIVYAKLGTNVILKGSVLLISPNYAFIKKEMEVLNERELTRNVKCEVLQSNKLSEIQDFFNKKRRLSESVDDTNSNQITSPHSVPPMTFDQQTQTDPKITGQYDISANARADLIHLIAVQKSLVAANKELKKSSDSNQCQNEKMSEELKSLRNLVGEIRTKVLRMNYQMEDVEVLQHAEENHSDYNTDEPDLSFGREETVTSADGSLTGSRFRKLGIKPYIPEGGRTIRQLIIDDHDNFKNNDELFAIGRNNTTVPKSVLYRINWESHSTATRKLLATIFTREILATHSLTGKPSPAFMDRNMPLKDRLDEKIIADIVECVTKNCNVSDTAVRTVITTKCADENKMQRMRSKKNDTRLSINKENANQTL